MVGVVQAMKGERIKRLLFHREVEVRKGVLEASDEVTESQELPRKISCGL